MKAYLAVIRIDLKLALRQRSVIFFNYLFPLIFFFIFAQLMHGEQGGIILQVFTMVTVIGVLGSGLFGAGMRAVQERETNILRRYKVTPISPMPLLVASMVTGLLLYLPYIALMITLAHFIYGMHIPVNVISVFLFISAGTVAFRAIGLIIASVVNSMQESAILVQVVYLAMLFLSGTTFPVSMFPNWLQIVAQFIPATYLVSGMQAILTRGESVLQNWAAFGAMLLTTVVATFIASKIFRWEKEEKIKPASKLWILGVLLPFFVLGIWQAYSKENLGKQKVLSREMRRSRTLLIRNARIFTSEEQNGKAKVIESGAILIRAGKIEKIFEGASPEAKSLQAEALEAAGKTVIPGLIDVHVHLGSPGGVLENWKDYSPEKAMERELAAYLYSGVTTVKSAGDPLNMILQVRQKVNSGERLGAELLISGPLFTTAGGHGTEYFKQMPEQTRNMLERELTRQPKTADEAREQVDLLAKEGVDAIKTILEAGSPAKPFPHMKLDVFRAVVAEAKARHLPVVSHTGDAQDVTDAVAARVDAIEHGSYRDGISPSVLASMARDQIFLDPTLGVVEAFLAMAKGDVSLLSRSLVQQVGPANLLNGTRKMLQSSDGQKTREEFRDYPMSLDQGKANLLAAWHAGVPLATGSDAGNLMVIHGPTVQRELELWVEAGIPVDVALRAATSGAAKLLRISNRTGSLKPGMEATMVIVDGNPLQDIHALESISTVIFKGENVDRSPDELLDPK